MRLPRLDGDGEDHAGYTVVVGADDVADYHGVAVGEVELLAGLGRAFQLRKDGKGAARLIDNDDSVGQHGTNLSTSEWSRPSEAAS